MPQEKQKPPHNELYSCELVDEEEAGGGGGAAGKTKTPHKDLRCITAFAPERWNKGIPHRGQARGRG